MDCIISGCHNEGKHNFGVRLRRPDTTAIWAPNTEAFLCDRHAGQGLRITVVLEPTRTRRVETRVCSIPQFTPARRVTPIRRKA